MRRLSLTLSLLPLALAAACGGSSSHDAGHGSDATDATAGASVRTIDVTMTEFAFSPSRIEVAEGESVTLRFHNDGEIVHEAVIADAAAQAEHGESMAGSTGDDGHDGHDMEGVLGLVVLQPGLDDSARITVDDDLLIVCHQPGHEAAGMVAELVVD